MEIAHHAMEIFEAPTVEIRDAIRQWLNGAGFKVSPSSPSDPAISAKSGNFMGVSDRKTEWVMEIIVRSVGDFTAVSFYHHTTRVGPIVGATFGDLLREEALTPLNFLAEKVAANDKQVA